MPFKDAADRIEYHRQWDLEHRPDRIQRERAAVNEGRLLAAALLVLSGVYDAILRARVLQCELRRIYKREWDRLNRPGRAMAFLDAPRRKRVLESFLNRRLTWADFHLRDSVGAREG